MKHIVYFTSLPILPARYTHEFISKVFECFISQGTRVTLSVPDNPQELQLSFIETFLSPALHEAVLTGDVPVRGHERTKDSVLFCSGTLDFWRYAFLYPRHILRMRRLLWYQGLESDESFYRHRSRFRQVILRLIEALTFTMQSVIVVPSPAMKRIICRRHPWLDSNAVEVLPNLVEGAYEPIELPHRLWGFEEKPALALGYVGGISAWQCFDEMCGIVTGIQEAFTDSWFLVLSPFPDEVRKKLISHRIERFKVLSVSAREVAAYATAFDAGFLLRKDNIINEVACPLKWLEYWRCGVPIITTKAVEIINSAACLSDNCIIDLEHRSEAIATIVKYLAQRRDSQDSVRARLRLCVDKNWTWSKWQNIFERIFDTLSL